MGRGPGRWQRLILDALVEAIDEYGPRLGPGVWLAEYARVQMGRPLTNAEYKALMRAAAQLERRGAVARVHVMGTARNRDRYPHRLVVTDGTDVPRWQQLQAVLLAEQRPLTVAHGRVDWEE